MTLFYGPPSCHRPRVPCRKKRCRRRRPCPKPAPPSPPSPPPPPPIGQRTQIAFVIEKYQFSGLSLFDGDSNADINGTTSIPGTPLIQGNRGTAISGYAATAPFANTGNAVYTAAISNNDNAVYNPTFAATDSGQAIPSTDSRAQQIIGTLASFKSAILKQWLGSDLKAQKKSVQSEKFQQQLGNYGSGLEIESWVLPPLYQSPSDLSSIWATDDAALNKHYKFQLESDFRSIQFTTDAKNYSDWVNTIPTTSSNCLEKAIGKFISTAISSSGWVNVSSDSVTVAITLLTGVMLPSLQLTSSGANMPQEFSYYVQNEYTVESSFFREYQLGDAVITNTTDSCVTVDFSLSTAPEGAYPFEKVASQFIRGNDGQLAVSASQVASFIASGAAFSIPTAKRGGLASNPWSDFLQNQGPSFSATLLTSEIEFPILWYDAAYVDPFFGGCPGCVSTT